ncbi:MAG: hypothetical protein OEQ47_05120, partial [Acidimicrobiia bacterium]|nr:hypothetical protein [Acidimicrobiia bacterium]
EKDQHDRWRYLTLGFGDQMAWLSAQTTAQTVDGNYHSARRLPELITTPVERLEGAKFRGIPGLGSLQQFLGTPERYHLKYVFSNDQFYDPLLHFSGWRRLQRLENGVVVWEREDVPPLPAAVSRPDLPALHGFMWGLLPPAALLAAAVGATAGWWRPRPPRSPRFLVASLDERLRNAAVIHPDEDGRAGSWKEPFRRLAGRLVPSDTVLKLGGALAGLSLVAAFGLLSTGGTPGPADVIEGFYEDLDYRRFEDAWRRLHPADRPSLDEYLLRLSVEDGLVDSYSALESVTVSRLRPHPGGATADVEVVWMTSLAEYRATHTVDLVEDGDVWWIRLPDPDPSEAVERLARRVEVVYEAPGRRTVTTGSTEYDDVLDRPELAMGRARLVLADGRPVVVGSLRNIDADPASVTVTAGLGSPSEAQPPRGNARLFVQHSLLPGEWTPYRVDFEGVAGLETGDFDPMEFTEAPIPADVDSVRVDAAGVVTTRGLERPVSVRDVSTTLEASNLVRLEGEILNLGTTDVTVTGLIVSLFDLEGELIWVDWILVSDSTRPGLTTRFSDVLTDRRRIESVDAGVAGFANGLPVELSGRSPSLIPLPVESGYSGFMLTAVVFQRPAS